MAMRAETNNAFLMKYLVIGLICVGFGLYSVYDGFYAFPAELPRAEAWEKIKKDFPDDDAAADAQYKKMAEEKGWDIKHPGKDESVESIKNKINWQFLFMALGFGLGIPLVVWFLRSKGSWIELDEETIRSSSGSAFSFDQVIKFDKKKWDKKGIGVVHYRDGDAQKTFLIDDLKYERKTTDEIVRIMENSLKPEQIINGAPEKKLTLAELQNPVETNCETNSDSEASNP